MKKLFHEENCEEETNDDVYLSFKKNLCFDNKKERYETKFSFKEYSEILPDNGKVKKGKDYEPLALINSCFGWIVCGYYEQPSVSTNFVSSTCYVQILNF